MNERPRHLAMDFGGSRIGLAVSDPIGDGVGPLTTVERRNDQQAVEDLARIMDEYDVRVCVVGLPVEMDGQEGVQARRTRSFIGRLRKVRPDAEYVFQDERLSTFEADEWMKRRGIRESRKQGLRDQLAAVVILEDYLGRSE